MTLLKPGWAGCSWFVATCAMAIFQFVIRDQAFAVESRNTLFLLMIALSLPLSLVTIAACALVEKFFDLSHPIYVEFPIAIIVGYVQWAVIVPYLLNRHSAAEKRTEPG